MTLVTAIQSYVALKRSLGAVFTAQEAILRAFGRTVGDIALEAISAEACSTFCRGAGLPTRFWENKHQTLRGFFNYLVSRGHLAASPLQEPGPRAQRSFQPYIYSHEELQRLLGATDTLTSTRFPLQPLTYRTLPPPRPVTEPKPHTLLDAACSLPSAVWRGALLPRKTIPFCCRIATERARPTRVETCVCASSRRSRS